MEKDQLIHKYFNEELTPKEQDLFDSLLSNDVEFNDDVQLYKDLRLAIRDEERHALKQELKDLHKPKRVSMFSRYMAAASVTLLIIIGSYFAFNNTTISNQQLYASNFEPYQNVMHPLVRGTNDLTTIEEAFVAYENKDYIQFIEMIEEVSITKEDYRFYVANAYMAQEKLKNAKPILIDYLKNPSARFASKAHWYLGLIYLNKDNIEEAKKHFLIVKTKGDFKLKTVTGLLGSLE